MRTVKPSVTKPKRPEFKAPTIGAESRPKTAPGRPGLAGRDALRKTLGGDLMRRPVKAAKRRSKSADRVEKPKQKATTSANPSVASNSKMPKRKGKNSSDLIQDIILPLPIFLKLTHVRFFTRNRTNQKMMVADWLITNHVT